MSHIKVRDTLAEDYKRSYEKAGVHASWEAFQQLAEGDLALTDKVNNEITPQATGTQRTSLIQEREQEQGPSIAEQMAGDLKGGRFVKREIDDSPVIQSPKKALQAVIGEKHTALMRRLAMIVQCEPSLKRHEFSDRPYRYPALAKDVMTAHTDFSFGRREYRFLNQKDKERKFLRAIEDIADRSNAVFGVNWWLK